MKYINREDAKTIIDTYNFALFPVHGVIKGSCTCGDVDCKNKGKHPATLNGLKDATKDIDTLINLFAKRRGLNVAIATGEVSGIFVVDIDGPEGAQDWENFVNSRELPKTLTSITARGKHLFFRHPGMPIKTRTRVIGQKVDIRGAGGYVVAPGSNHASGHHYTWEDATAPISQAPDWVIERVIAQIESKQQAPAPVFPRRGLNIHNDDIEQILSYIDPDCSYDEWIQVGMALQDEGHPFSVFDSWSKRGAKYDGKTIGSHWKSFKGGGGISMGTVINMARKGGYRQNERVPAYTQPSPVRVSIEKIEQIEESVEKIDKNPARVLPLLYANDIKPVTECRDFVEDLLRDGEFSVIYGESNCGKTFFMLDLAMHVALGKKWRGKQVDQGGVIYAALEGGHGTRNRIYAFKKHNNVTEDIPLAVIPSSINFLDSEGDMQSLINAVCEAKDRLGNVRLIVIDTLARAISGGDENTSKDMGQLIINADILRELTNAHIAFIHHSGKDSTKGARGHSSLRAAVDTEIEISRTDIHSPSKIEIVKQREMEIIDPMAFTLDRIVIGTNSRGKEVASCVAIPCEVAQDKQTKTMTAMQTFVYDAILDCLLSHGVERTVLPGVAPLQSITYSELRQTLENKGFKGMIKIKDGEKTEATPEQVKSATQTARVALKKMGKISFTKDHIWLV